MIRNLYDRLRSIKLPKRMTFFMLGIASTVWFLIRVIPKFSWAGYPCMKAAAPFMSSFVIYLLSVSGSALLFKRSSQFFKRSKYILAAGAFAGALVLFTFSSNLFPEKLSAAIDAAVSSDFPANLPMGEEISCYSNPVTDLMHVKLQLESVYTGNVSVELYNMAGMSLISHDASLVGGEGSISLDLSGQTAGYYILRVYPGSESYSFFINIR